MKILYHHRTVSKDGQDVHIGEMVAALRRRGHEVLVAAPPMNQATEFGGGGGMIARLRQLLPRAVCEGLELAYSLPAYARLLQAWNSFRPDLIYERYNLHLLAGLWLRRHSGTPLLLEVNAPLCHERTLHGGLGLHGLARWSEGAVWRAADAVLPVTRVLAGHVIAAGVAEDRIQVIPNGVDRARFVADGVTARRELGLEGRLVLGFSGFLRGWHGLAAALEVMAELPELPDLHLLVIGDGPARAELEARACVLGLKHRLTVLGVVPRERVPGLLAAVDVALQPSAVDYASPLKLFEYMAAGRAVVAPDQPNIREVLTDNEDALLFPPGDLPAFRDAIQRLCRDDALRHRLGAAARATLDSGGYSWDGNAARVEALARRLLSAKECLCPMS
jgi:glycosyltransferase involved in cell wall biosynthesis